MKYLRAAVKMILFVSSTIGLYSIWLVGSFFIPNKLFWRQIAFQTWSRAFAKIANMKIETIGDVPRPPFFLVSNHLSYTDIPAIRCVADGVFVAKGEIEDWFLGGRIVRDMGIVFIDRNNRRDIPRAGEQITERLENGEGVIIFPEGTSTIGAEVLPFNSSFLEFAARTDFPVSYASISYRTPNASPNASDVVCWWEDISFFEHLWRLFQINEFTAVISFGEETLQNPNRKELARELREKVSEKFIPVL